MSLTAGLKSDEVIKKRRAKIRSSLKEDKNVMPAGNDTKQKEEYMKVILLQDVKSLGKEGEVVNVSDGYARNYVIPKKLGVEANEKNKNDLKLKKLRQEKEAAAKLADAQKLAQELGRVTVVVKMKAGENGRVFGSVSAKEISQEAKKQHNLDLDKKKIQLQEPIKSFGNFEIPIRLHPQVTGKFMLKVVEA